MKKSLIEVWWFDDETINHRLLLSLISNKRHLKKRVKLECFTSVKEELFKVGSPDLIIIDTSTLTKYMYVENWEKYALSMLRAFVEKHTSSILIISSAVKLWALDFSEEIRKQIPELEYVKIIEDGVMPTLEIIEDYSKIKC